MKKPLFTLGLVGMLSTISMAQEEMVNEISTTTKKSKPVSIMAGYSQQDATYGSNEDNLGDVDYRGLSLSAGVEWLPGAGFTTQSKGHLNVYTNYGYAGERISDELDIALVEMQLEQTLGYNFIIGNGNLTPFIGAGAGIATFSAEALNYNITITQNYTKTFAVAGAQYSFSNGLTPFVRYEMTKYSTSGDTVVSGLGNSVEEEILADADGKNLTIGLGIVF